MRKLLIFLFVLVELFACAGCKSNNSINPSSVSIDTNDIEFEQTEAANSLNTTNEVENSFTDTTTSLESYDTEICESISAPVTTQSNNTISNHSSGKIGVDTATNVQSTDSVISVNSITSTRIVLEPTEENLKYMEDKLFALVNEVRIENGKEPLIRNENLDASADVRSEEIKDVFDHIRPNGSYFPSAISGFACYSVAENIGDCFHAQSWVGEMPGFTGADTELEHLAEIMNDAFKNSSGHFQNMIGDYTHGGISISYRVVYPENISERRIEFFFVELFAKQ